MDRNSPRSFFTIPESIILGAILISLSILVSSGVIRIRGFNYPAASTTKAVSFSEGQNGLLTQQQIQGGQQSAAPSPAPRVNMVLGHLPVKGDKNAKVAIVEFGDMRCPFCKRFFESTENQILTNYVNNGKAKFAFRQYEFLGPASLAAGNASECANEQGKFWEYHDYLYKNQPDESDTSIYSSDQLTSVATSLGLIGPTFRSCLDSTKYSKNLTDDQNEGQQVGISGTPSFIIGKLDDSGEKIINGQLIVGAQPYSVFQAALDQQLSF